MKTAHKVGLGGMSAAGAVLAAALVSHWEGKSYVAEHLPFDPPGVITVCGGITNHDIPGLKIGMKFTEAMCENAWQDALPRYSAPIAKCVPAFVQMPPHRQGALVSFSVNLGPWRICGTSIGRDLNAGRIKQACDAMRQYIRANRKVLKGLVNRRNDPVWGERAWCLRED